MSVTYAGGVAAEAADAAGVRARPAHRGLAAAAGLVAVLSGVAIVVLHTLNGALPLTDWWTGTATIALASGALGWLVAHQAPANPIGWLMCAAGAGNGLCGAGREYLAWSLTQGRLPGALWVGALADSLFIVSMAALPIVLMIFPDGRPLPGRWWRVALVAIPIAGALAWLGVLMSPDPQPVAGHSIDNPFAVLPDQFVYQFNGVNSLTYPVLALVAIASLVVRYRRADAATRRRLVGVMWAGAIALIEAAFELLPAYTIGPALGPLTEVLFLGAIATGIVRYRLLDVELVINRTLVYVTASGLLLGAYLGVVTVVSRLGDRNGLGGPLLGTALVAVAFAPLRFHLQRGVDRLMYGDRGDPYGVMSSLGRQLERSEAPGAELGIVLDVVTGSLKLPYAAFRGPDGGLLAEVGRPRGPVIGHPLAYRSEPMGALEVCPRTPGSGLGAADERLLADLARQSGALLHAVRLAGDLQESRRRMVTAKEEERRRLRRDLHDGLGPELAALTLKVDGAALQLEHRPERTAELLRDVRTGLTGTIDEIRRLVYDLRPPALDELGLLGALRDFARRLDTAGGARPLVSVEAADEWPALPAAVEVAAYRIATEAVTNVVRHADADRCTVRLEVAGDRLRLEVADDGCGLPSVVHAGVGTRSIAERATEIGGTASISPGDGGRGTVVRAELPLVVS
jgi:two-component system, NarL family, sensor kinase